jgi:hypothetical protein
MEGRGDGANGAVIGEYVCFGYLYAANVGWLGFGGGAPANGIRYQNNSGTDYGVNHDGQGSDHPQPYVSKGKTGRNDSCPCGSGKKYKKCCGKV